MAFDRCAVVRDVSPPAIGPSSITVTERPSRVNRYAVVRPAIPAPTMHTSTERSPSSTDGRGRGQLAIQTETVFPAAVSMLESGAFRVPTAVRHAMGGDLALDVASGNLTPGQTTLGRMTTSPCRTFGGDVRTYR